jgi:hypothetical protein
MDPISVLCVTLAVALAYVLGARGSRAPIPVAVEVPQVPAAWRQAVARGKGVPAPIPVRATPTPQKTPKPVGPGTLNVRVCSNPACGKPLPSGGRACGGACKAAAVAAGTFGVVFAKGIPTVALPTGAVDGAAAAALAVSAAKAEARPTGPEHVAKPPTGDDSQHKPAARGTGHVVCGTCTRIVGVGCKDPRCNGMASLSPTSRGCKVCGEPLVGRTRRATRCEPGTQCDRAVNAARMKADRAPKAARITPTRGVDGDPGVWDADYLGACAD